MNSTLFLRSGRLPTNANRIRYRAWSFRRTLIAAPGPRSGPLLSRRADRELPSIDSHRRWIRTLPLFAAAIGVSMLAIFNYQKSSSSVVNSTMYALRTSPKAREFLGDEIYFAQKIPWIGGEINQLHGRIDISFWVKGTRAKGKMRFKSTRENRMGFVSFFLFLFFFFSFLFFFRFFEILFLILSLLFSPFVFFKVQDILY
ncbi:hypothetical protein CPC735_002050 [Coccidioides posadasii C735 delta SOWgp]|uniref:Cytochrome oxidase complex assembly protein n=1 Tax=Coccidioides posadasii (strain C735) TaxID=222929 RepID=C5P8H6_COCP7|nr:hypothetical protein CPC735_002050 [Coccidioides posadasii C735 delta SOWgp]EER26038.1 hypothetical protein CPC735_002050 [Coccidioides posadasii C735 delta SOWgp]|eukprot:XP_003068183.1 hypothetical protein CPC735_002050 [Coccidioides posadasii C735 delta SOWgp]